MKKTTLTLVIFIISVSLFAQSWQDTVNQIDKIFARYKPGIPGTELAISRNGQIIFSKAWGMADLEHNISLTPQSPTEAGSVSKQFTSAAILLLEQEGKLSLDDDIRKYVPELPDYKTKITLRQMMQHTSGLRDWGAIAGIAGWPRGTKTYSNEDALYIISNQRGLNHRPGDEYLYSNSNYNLFAIIVHRVSGESLASYTKKKIFEPAGMKNTQWRDNFKRVVPNRAIAYSRSLNVYQTNMPNENVYGNGGLLTTAEDLVTWCNYYGSGKLGNPSLLQRQIACSFFNNGKKHDYAAGLFITKFRGWDLYTHDGATASYRSNLDYYPELNLSIAWLSNSSEFDRDTFDVVEAVANLFVPVKSPEQQPAVVNEVSVPEEILKSYTGWYRNPRTGAGVRFYINNGKLASTQARQMKAISKTVFAINTSRVEMQNSKERKFLFISPTKDSTYLTGVDSAMINEQTVAEYAGEYYSKDCDCKGIMKVKNGKLFLTQPPQTEIPLTPTYKDGFDSPVGNFYFERDKNKKITGFKFSTGRARNVEFERR